MSTVIKKGGVGVLLDAVGATGAGGSFTPESRHCTFHLVISATATVKLQASWDNSVWIDLPGTTKTATDGVSIAEWYPYIRANVTSFSSGTVTVKMAVAPGDGVI